ncbi:unnamed protein product [Hydatigera taeniaeformis]|uniref:Protein kinase domain-containing protein n=1 Tax=Hydatigena taeniaeformis TaxID=6205 RepID=A0A158REK0_HYDTA|nr:unnamed protein product [Hydatigera taeniaeformis]
MIWNQTPVSVRSVLNELSGQFSQNLNLFERSLHSAQREILWLSRLRHPNIILLLGVTRPMSDLEVPSLVFERIQMGCLHTMILKEHNRLSLLDRLTVLRQIIEALIYLKNLGIVHTTVSSHSIYLADLYHSKLAHFEHALHWHEWCEEGRRKSSRMRLSEEEIKHLGAWLAPEVVLLNQSPEIELESKAQTMSLNAHHSTIGSGSSGKYCMLTPATDTFGVARVMQELFEPCCAHRFRRSAPATSKEKLVEILEEAGEKNLHFYLRPVIKKALRGEYTARGEVEDLHIAVELAFRDLLDKRNSLQLQGRINAMHWCECDSVYTNTVITSPFKDSKSEEGLFDPAKRGTSKKVTTNFENKSKEKPASQIFTPLSTSFLTLGRETSLPEQYLSSAGIKCAKVCQEAQDVTASNAIGSAERRIDGTCF